MSQTFKFCLYTKQRLSEVRTARVLWRLLDNPLISPHRFDALERAKLLFRPNAAAEAARLYEEERFLFVTGKKDSFVAMFRPRPKGLATWDFWLDVKTMQGERGEKWLKWFFRLCDELPALYGFGCSLVEYDTKHEEVRTLPSGRTMTSGVGMSIAEFWEYLPGIYWLTVFGPELVQAFGKEKLASLPGVRVTELEAGQVAIRIDEPVIPDDMEERLKREGQLADILGPTFFFDRTRNDLQFEPVPALLKALNAG